MRPEQMQTGLFDGIDWTRPWLAPFRQLAEPVVRAQDWHAALNERAAALDLRNHRGLPIRFVPQASLPAGMAYEAFISATGGVPTRDNLHDFFNALVWLSFPKVKVQLNALQAAEIEKTVRETSGNMECKARGRVRDAATIFDENAALLVLSDAALGDDFREHRWNALFLEKRQVLERECEVWLFGHALMEKLIHPYKAITAHAWPVIAPNSFRDLPYADKRSWLDAAVSHQLEGGLATSDFTPLPVLGVPGWWDGQDPAFYADSSVFRGKRKKECG